ncbi:LexA repressor [Comamonas aquatica]|uniref:XRE family transcriptional regulator n=1 Tax=Comamonas aquatica TaxID=225991 RepID=UPI001EF24DFE|nr:XRE family transcriptional regulator [Comamonas aquatica]CAB5686986.1 LexA repressor [Comamonas aquatica]CAC9212049.1 LexA repressor [Comamonas aquatica]
MKSIQERLAEIFPPPMERGFMARIAELCDVSRPTVSAWFNNPEKVISISRTNAEKICAAFATNISPAWLAEGIGSKELSENVVVADHRNIEPGPDLRAKVPLVSWVQAGAWCEAVHTTHVTEAERWMDCPVAHSSQTFALRVRGDSMTAPSGAARTYPEGCFIFVDPERKNPVNGDRVVACLLDANEVTFKVYKNEDGRQWLQPLNPTHEPIREPFRVLGTVLGKWEDG